MSTSHALHQVKTSAQALLSQGKTDEACDLLLSALESVLDRNRDLELLVMKLRRERLGRTSERVDPAQLALLFESLQAQSAPGEPHEAEAESREDEALAAEVEAEQATRAGRRRQSRKGETSWTTKLAERQVHQVPVPQPQRECTRCHRPMKTIGHEVTRRLELVPARFVEHEHRLEKLACGRCKDGVTVAPAPPQVLDRCGADASLLADIVVSKYADHVPLHRLSRVYERTGAQVPVSTLCDWVAGVADMLMPLADAIEKRVLAATVVRTDATGLKVLDPKSPDHIERGSIWAYVGDDRDVLFKYTETGAGATGPWKLLAGRTGYVQADAASVHDRLFNGRAAAAIEVGCWAHARRRFFQLKDTDCRAAYPLKQIARMYRVERLATLRDAAPEQRLALRQRWTVPILERLHDWLVNTAACEPPSSALAKAAQYAVNHWQALTRFVEDGCLDIDNNHCESQLRGIALGRKNYLFAGSHDAARRTAVLYSLVRTCAEHGVPPLPYLTDVLRSLGAGWPARQVDQLLPHAWKARQAVVAAAPAT